MQEARTHSAADKLKAITRELGWRRVVYPKRVAEGRMKQADADLQIAIFEAIARDYRAAADAEDAKGRLL